MLCVHSHVLVSCASLFVSRAKSWCVKRVAKLVPQVVKDGENFGQLYSSSALSHSAEIVID